MEKAKLFDILNENQREYDFSLAPNTFSTKELLPIICHKTNALGEHGVFYRNVDKLKRGDGCPICSGRGMTKELFAAEAAIVHNGLYTYDNFEWINKRTKGDIYCTKHNIYFQQTPVHHLAGQGCPKCRYEKSAKSKTKPFEFVLERCFQVHGDKYTYHPETYVNGYTEMTITCPVHGNFTQTPNNHISFGQGCPSCARERTIEAHRLDTEEYKRRAIARHGDLYDYSELDYIDSESEVKIRCKKHGFFKQIARNHLFGQGCPVCKSSKLELEIRQFLIDSDIEFIEQYNRQWLGLQKLDFYLPKYKVGIECQGKQHFFEEYQFGSDEDAYKLNQERDKAKLQKCIDNGVKLLYYSNLGIDYPYHVFEDKNELLKEIIK